MDDTIRNQLIAGEIVQYMRDVQNKSRGSHAHLFPNEIWEGIDASPRLRPDEFREILDDLIRQRRIVINTNDNIYNGRYYYSLPELDKYLVAIYDPARYTNTCSLGVVQAWLSRNKIKFDELGMSSGVFDVIVTERLVINKVPKAIVVVDNDGGNLRAEIVNAAEPPSEVWRSDAVGEIAKHDRDDRVIYVKRVVKQAVFVSFDDVVDVYRAVKYGVISGDDGYPIDIALTGRHAEDGETVTSISGDTLPCVEFARK